MQSSTQRSFTGPDFASQLLPWALTLLASPPETLLLDLSFYSFVPVVLAAITNYPLYKSTVLLSSQDFVDRNSIIFLVE